MEIDMVFIDHYIEPLNRHIIVDEDVSYGWAYLTKANSHSIDIDCWLYNRIITPDSSKLFLEIDMYRQIPPPVPHDLLKEQYPLDGFLNLKNEDFTFLVNDEDGVIYIFVNNSHLASIDYVKRCTYNIWLNRNCAWGKCLIL